MAIGGLLPLVVLSLVSPVLAAAYLAFALRKR
jgi:hypothetical protein